MKSGLRPIARADAKLLILGSLPGDASLAAGKYYSHPRNHFWPLLSGIMGMDLVAMAYDERVDAVQAAGIALWDVVESAHRPGSLDQQIREVQMNNLPSFASELPDLRAIAFNGQKSAALAGNAFGGAAVDLVRLPSSSSANTLNLEAKRAIWAVLAKYLSLEMKVAISIL